MSTNAYARFVRLLPSQPVQVSTVIASGGGACTVQLPGGAQLVVRGEADVGASVFIRGGAIEGLAPSLPLVTAVV